MRHLTITLACFFVSSAAAFAGEGSTFDQFLAGVGLPVSSGTVPTVSLESASQDFGHLTTNASCHTHTPLRIGQKSYAKGLGSHANARIVFRLNKAFRAFTADVGIDNNDDTRKGAAVAGAAFVVKGDGRHLGQTPVCRFGQPVARHRSERGKRAAVGANHHGWRRWDRL